jgi:hypothetical protein
VSYHPNPLMLPAGCTLLLFIIATVLLLCMFMF